MKKSLNFNTLETARLIAHLPHLDFLDNYSTMLADAAFINCYGIYFTRQQAEERLLSDINDWQEHGFAPWMWRDKITGEYVGRAGLKICEIEGRKEIELAYAIEKKFWGQGLAHEMGLAAIEFGKSMGLQNLVCFTLTKNIQSQRVMEKCGFQYERDFLHRDLPHKLYKLGTI